MQIHELNLFEGKPDDMDFFAIDNGYDTAKISAGKMLAKKVNQPLDNAQQPTNGTAGQLLRSKGDGSTEWGDVGLPTDEQTAMAVSAWLDDHPEATTTVLDGSLTEAKFSAALKLKTIKDYVTPEMFGAVGDGVTDDTQAIQDAIDSGNTVIIPNKTYAISGLTLDGYKVLFSFGHLVSSSYLFRITGDENVIKLFSECIAADEGIIFDTTNTVKSIGFNTVFAKAIRVLGKYGVKMIAPQFGIYDNNIHIEQLNWKYAADESSIEPDINSNNAAFGYYFETSGTGFINRNFIHETLVQRFTSAVKMVSGSSNIMNDNTFYSLNPEHSLHGIILYGNSSNLIGNHFLRVRNLEVTNDLVMLFGTVSANDFSFTVPVRGVMFASDGSLSCLADNYIQNGCSNSGGGKLWGCPTLLTSGVDGNPALFPTTRDLGTHGKMCLADVHYDINGGASNNYHDIGVINVSPNATAGINIYLSTSFGFDRINKLIVWVLSGAGTSYVWFPYSVDGNGNLQYKKIATLPANKIYQLLIDGVQGDSLIIELQQH